MWPWSTTPRSSSRPSRAPCASANNSDSPSRVSSRSPLLAAAPHPSRLLRLRSRSGTWGRSQEKMVIVIRKDLGMGAGKLAAQAATAALELYRRHCNSYKCNRWYNTGAKKIVLRVENERQLERIADDARKHGLPVAVITGDDNNNNNNDHKLRNSKTALSILGNSQKVDAITGSLRLLY